MPDGGCINLATPKYVTGADSVAATLLFKNNNIDYSTLRYQRVILNDSIRTGPNAGVYQHVFAVKYYNGLPVLSSTFGHHFFKGVFQSVSPMPPASINLSNTPNLTLPALRQTYISAAAANHATFNSADACLAAQFGYFDLNAGSGSSVANYVKAWVVTPANADYPMAIIRDDDGSVLYYVSGIILF